jgi:hypothetical protein
LPLPSVTVHERPVLKSAWSSPSTASTAAGDNRQPDIHVLISLNRSGPLETRDRCEVMEEAGEIATRDLGQHLPAESETAA